MAELADGAIVVELPFAGIDWLVREILKEAGDAAVLEPADAREAVREAAERLAAGVLESDLAALSLPPLEPPRADSDDATTRSPRSSRSSAIVVCATNGRDGWPHLMPLWYVVRDGELWAWTYAKSQKVRNLERDDRGDAAGRGRPRVPRAARRDDQGASASCTATSRRSPEWARSSPPATPAPTPSARRPARWSASQAAKRVALQFHPPRRRPGTTASSEASTDGGASGPDPLRRQGNAAAADHPHLGQAARAGGQQARAVLRDRGHGRGGDQPTSGSSSRRRRATRSARPSATARASESR